MRFVIISYGQIIRIAELNKVFRSDGEKFLKKTGRVNHGH